MLDLSPIKDLTPVLKELIAELRAMRKEMAILTALLQELQLSSDPDSLTVLTEKPIRPIYQVEKQTKRAKPTLCD